MCHLGNVSHRLGTLQPLSEPTKSFGDDKEAAATFARMLDHLKENKVSLDETKYQLGRKLILDAKTETFVNDKEANAMLTRELSQRASRCPRRFDVGDKLTIGLGPAAGAAWA